MRVPAQAATSGQLIPMYFIHANGRHTALLRSTLSRIAAGLWLIIAASVLVACDAVTDAANDAANDNAAKTATQSGSLTCSSATTDYDGDGWGWENGRSCKVATQPSGDTANLPVGIVYYVWHCITKTDVYERLYRQQGLPAGEEFNTTHVLTGRQNDWGEENRFHWWDKPQNGYYCLGDEPGVIENHLTLLRDAGIDFLVIDITNHPNIGSLAAEDFILKSLRPLLDAAMRVDNAPRIVPWVPLIGENSDTRAELNHFCSNAPRGSDCAELTTAHNQSMLDHVTSLLRTDYAELMYEYQGKPLLLEAANDDIYPRAITDTIRPQLAADWTVRRTWGLRRGTTDWQFLSTCSDAEEFYNSHGWTDRGCNQPVNAGEQISVTAAYQYTYISDPLQRDSGNPAQFLGGMPKFYGRTLAQQFRVAFENRNIEPLVLITGWNEWIASRFIVDGRNVFVDAYNHELNRDIEPGGSSGDYYYFLMRRLIAHYRSGDNFDFDDYFLTRKSILDTNYYWNTYADLQAVYEATDTEGLTAHWLNTGVSEGRRPGILFDAAYYAQNHNDLSSSGINTHEALLQHFLDTGFPEGRQGSAEFHASAYINRYEKIRSLFGDHGFYQAYRYFVETGQFAPENHNPAPD